MDAKEFARAVGEAVIKFGRAPEAMIKSILDSNPHKDDFSENDSADHVLADFLLDHEDPREQIVRRDLSYRNRDIAGYFKNSDAHLEELVGKRATHRVIVTNPEHQVTKFSKPHSDRVAYSINWSVNRSDGIRSVYSGHFTPEEAEPILQHFGVEER